MKRYFVDANVFLRFFANDDRAQHAKARRLLERAESGEIELLTGPPVFFETAWTLRRRYKYSQPEVNQRLMALCGIRGLEILDRDTVEAALKKCTDFDIDFADAYIATFSVEIGADAVATFNVKDFTKAKVAAYEL
jgi:predicted nucleic acid-binding protein